MKVNKTLIMADVTTHQAIVHFIASHIREASEAQKIAAEIEQVAYSYDIQLLVLNFSRLQQMTSAFIGRLIALHKTLKPIGIELRLCCMSREVEKAFKICKLDKIIPLYRTEKKALSG
jgi:anti-anti-sigma factor